MVPHGKEDERAGEFGVELALAICCGGSESLLFLPSLLLCEFLFCFVVSFELLCCLAFDPLNNGIHDFFRTSCLPSSRKQLGPTVVLGMIEVLSSPTVMSVMEVLSSMMNTGLLIRYGY